MAGGQRREGGLRTCGVPARRSAGKPLVSVITAVLHDAASLERTIGSVLAQRYPFIEYLVIDGGGDAETLNVIERHAGAIDYFLSEHDSGEYDATNKGIRGATGDFVCLLNAADTYHPDAISHMVECASAAPGAIIYTDYRYGARLLSPPKQLDAAFNLYNMRVAHQTLMVSRRLHMGPLGLYRTDFRIVSDYIWMRDAFRAGISFCKAGLCAVEIDDTGISSKRTTQTAALFETEFARRTRLLYPFLPDRIGRALFRFIHFDEGLGEIAAWIASAPFEPASPLWRDFAISLEACVREVHTTRDGAAHLQNLLRPLTARNEPHGIVN